jgi:hypothetical protein
MDANDVAAARLPLERLLAAVERGDLDASPAQVSALVGALEVLKALQQTDV